MYIITISILVYSSRLHHSGIGSQITGSVFEICEAKSKNDLLRLHCSRLRAIDTRLNTSYCIICDTIIYGKVHVVPISEAICRSEFGFVNVLILAHCATIKDEEQYDDKKYSNPCHSVKRTS